MREDGARIARERGTETRNGEMEDGCGPRPVTATVTGAATASVTGYATVSGYGSGTVYGVVRAE